MRPTSSRGPSGHCRHPSSARSRRPEGKRRTSRYQPLKHPDPTLRRPCCTASCVAWPPVGGSGPPVHLVSPAGQQNARTKRRDGVSPPPREQTVARRRDRTSPLCARLLKMIRTESRPRIRVPEYRASPPQIAGTGTSGPAVEEWCVGRAIVRTKDPGFPGADRSPVMTARRRQPSPRPIRAI